MPEALAGNPEQLAKIKTHTHTKKRGGVARLDLSSVCGGEEAGRWGELSGSRSPCQTARQPWAPTSIHFCASEKAGSGGGSGCRG